MVQFWAMLTGQNNNLLRACGDGDILLARKCLHRGATVNTRSKRSGDTPLHLASEKGYVSIVELLLTHGARVDMRNSRVHIRSDLISMGEHREVWRETPLHLAAREGHVNVVLMLLHAGADITAKISKGNIEGNGPTALHLAIAGGHAPTVRFLLSEGSDISSRDLSSMGRIGSGTPLDYAIMGESVEVLRELLISPRIGVEERQNGLMFALGKERISMAQLLVEHGASVKENGFIRILLSIYRSRLPRASLEFAIEQGADVNSSETFQDGSDTFMLNWSPLLEAVKWGHEEAVKILLENGASPIARAAQQWHDDGNLVVGNYIAPITLAEKKGVGNIVSLLQMQMSRTGGNKKSTE